MTDSEYVGLVEGLDFSVCGSAAALVKAAYLSHVRVDALLEHAAPHSQLALQAHAIAHFTAKRYKQCLQVSAKLDILPPRLLQMHIESLVHTKARLKLFSLGHSLVSTNPDHYLVRTF